MTTTRTALTALAAGLVLSSPAAAAAPETVHREVIPYSFAAPCDGFDILVDGAETISTTTFRGRDGSVTRIVLQDDFRETDTNSVTRTTVRFAGRRRDAQDLVAGTRTVTGHTQMTIPGEGDVIHDAGRVVFDAPFHVVFEAGIHDILHGNIDALACDALDGV